IQSEKQQRYRPEAPQHAVPEQFAKSQPRRQAINSERAVLNPAHGHRWQNCNDGKPQFDCCLEPENSGVGPAVVNKSAQTEPERPEGDQVENKTPDGAKAI